MVQAALQRLVYVSNKFYDYWQYNQAGLRAVPVAASVADDPSLPKRLVV